MLARRLVSAPLIRHLMVTEYDGPQLVMLDYILISAPIQLNTRGPRLDSLFWLRLALLATFGDYYANRKEH